MRCYNKNGKQVTSLNVPPSTNTNLCRMVPDIPGQCDWQQGMLMLGMHGSEHADLYVDSSLSHMDNAAVLAKEGAGLFMHGGNPVYYTMKGSAYDVAKGIHSILHNSLDDLAGNHIVLKLANDENTMQPFMYVHRTPLASSMKVDEKTASNSKDPIEYIYWLSRTSLRQTGGNRGWLYNLESDMKSEQAEVNKLYPTSTPESGSGNKWACPLLRFAFWSRVVKDFSPLVPSPIRASSLFGQESGRNMLRGTRSHPTQMFSSLYDRLANVLTSNGFCYCVNPRDCQIDHTDTANANCTLLETIRSLYDQKYRRVRLLHRGVPCTQQLDWPFEPGWMRDSSPNAGINKAEDACNVLDRLPPFQYAYKPVGTIKKPADGKTSLDEGGSCHMGRAAGWDPKMVSAVTATSLCKKIHSNYTHVVARCTNVDKTYTDYEMRKEKSAAPTWYSWLSFACSLGIFWS